MNILSGCLVVKADMLLKNMKKSNDILISKHRQKMYHIDLLIMLYKRT